MKKKLKVIIKFLIKTSLSKIFNLILGVFNFLIIFRSGKAIGDHVYMSSIIREKYFYLQIIMTYLLIIQEYLNYSSLI